MKYVVKKVGEIYREKNSLGDMITCYMNIMSVKKQSKFVFCFLFFLFSY